MNYRKLTRRLIALVRELQQELDYAHEDFEWAEGRHAENQGRLRAQLYELERQREDEEYDRYERQRKRDDALKDLERAHQYDDPYAESRALDRLRGI